MLVKSSNCKICDEELEKDTDCCPNCGYVRKNIFQMVFKIGIKEFIYWLLLVIIVYYSTQLII